MITLIKYDPDLDLTPHKYAVWMHPKDVTATNGHCAGVGDTMHKALGDAHLRLMVELHAINTLMGYSESLLAKEVQGWKGEW